MNEKNEKIKIRIPNYCYTNKIKIETWIIKRKLWKAISDTWLNFCHIIPPNSKLVLWIEFWFRAIIDWHYTLVEFLWGYSLYAGNIFPHIPHLMPNSSSARSLNFHLILRYVLTFFSSFQIILSRKYWFAAKPNRQLSFSNHLSPHQAEWVLLLHYGTQHNTRQGKVEATFPQNETRPQVTLYL